MGKHSGRAMWGTIVTVLIATGCGAPSPFAASDPSQASRGIAVEPVQETVLSSATLAGSSAKIDACSTRTAAIGGAGLDELVAGWPAKPKAAVKEIAAKYGMPLEATTESVVWHNAGPYKRIMVTKNEVPHDLPKPHMDFIEHTIAFDVPTQKVGDLVAFDSSMTISKTAGEMSARSDREAQNIRMLTLAREIISGKKSVPDARRALAVNVAE
jgi:hypothetical protein